jgi:7-cyano-7-deazaguanine synthase
VNVTVLLSGGIDSTACLEYYRQRHARLRALFINYGQPSSRNENRAALRVAKRFDLPLKRINVSGLRIGEGMIVGRNALLLCIALTSQVKRPALVAIGIHAGTLYGDCTPQFLSNMQSVFDLYTDGAVKLDAPFLRWSKREIVSFCEKAAIDLTETYSCESGSSKPCGICLSCRERGGLDVG